MSSVIRQNQILVKEAALTSETSDAANFIVKMNAYQPWFVFDVLDAVLVYFAIFGSIGRAHLAFVVYALILSVEGFVMRKKAVVMLETFPQFLRKSQSSRAPQALDPHVAAQAAGWAMAVLMTVVSLVCLAVALFLPMNAIRIIGALSLVILTRHHVRNALAYYRARDLVGFQASQH